MATNASTNEAIPVTRELTGFQTDLLYAVDNLVEPSGKDIERSLEADYGYDLNHGRLYPNLEAVIACGYVEKWMVDGRTNAYALTTEGVAELEADRRWRQ